MPRTVSETGQVYNGHLLTNHATLKFMGTTQTLLTPGELSEHLNGIPEQTLANWRWCGRGPAFVKVGKHVRYELADVEAWKAAQRRGGDLETLAKRRVGQVDRPNAAPRRARVGGDS
jgi:hypothetical protein